MNFSIANRGTALERIARALSTFTKAESALREAASDLLEENNDLAATVIQLETQRDLNFDAAARATAAAGKLAEITG